MAVERSSNHRSRYRLNRTWARAVYRKAEPTREPQDEKTPSEPKSPSEYRQSGAMPTKMRTKPMVPTVLSIRMTRAKRGRFRKGVVPECAARIQGQIGGKLVTITPREGRVLGSSKNNPDGDWGYHAVVVKGGRVYDSYTGPQGMPIEQYKSQFKHREVIDFGF